MSFPLAQFPFRKPRIGGPRHVLLNTLDGIGFDHLNERLANNGGGNSIITIPPPPVNVDPPDVSGGLTAQQVDQLAKQFETEEGAALAVAFGEHLIGGTLVSQLYDAGTPLLTYDVALGVGWADLGARGEWEGIVHAYHAGQELTNKLPYAVWILDSLPAGAIPVADTDGWNWVSVNPAPYLNNCKFSHQAPVLAGTHQHYFTDGAGLSIGTGDVITTYIFIDPVNPPTEIMVQFVVGAGLADPNHRAYWGANSIAFGTDGTNSRRQISASIPPTGVWTRLDVPASQVGLEGQTINGMGFTLFGGVATWGPVIRSNNGITAPGATGYVFRSGIIGPDENDIIQRGTRTTWPNGVIGNGVANVIVRVGAPQANEDRPDKFRCRVRARRTFNYDATGAQIDYSYSANPARVAADRILAFYQRIYRFDLAFAEAKFRARVDWASWVKWRDFCDALIPWNKDGSGNIFIPRFEANIAFLDKLTLAEILDQVTGLSATIWQDTGEQLRFVTLDSQIPIHHFNESNITGAPRVTPQDLRQIYNFFIAKYREFDDLNLGAVTTDVQRLDSIRRVGPNPTTFQFAGMRQSQAQRILESQARRQHDNPIYVALVGDQLSIRLLPGDFATVTHPLLDWDHQLVWINDITARSAEESADEVEFVVQAINGPLYDDTAHTPIQIPLTLP
jgi:hypothetical protein